MAVVNRQVVSPAVTTPTYNAATAGAGGDLIAHPVGAIVIIRNASGSPITGTVTATALLPSGGTYPNLVVTVPATTGERWVTLGPEFVDANGQAKIVWSAVTDVTFAVLST